MGWWRTANGAVIGDPVANYVDDLIAQGKAYTKPLELPPDVRQRIKRLYVSDLGREPTEAEIEAVLHFCLG